MKKQQQEALSESIILSSTKLPTEYWFEDACILDIDHFVKTLAGIKAKGVGPDLIGSIIAHYASKWLPDLAAANELEDLNQKMQTKGNKTTPLVVESVTTSWMKKRFFVETLIGILPQERDAIPCNFLLRLLKTASMVGVDPSFRADLERRVSLQLDQASIKDLMIPSFSHTCGTLLDVELVLRLVQRFVNLDDGSKSGVALAKVAKLVDTYLAEAAVDSNLTLPEFINLASALPSHSRALDDGLYRAIDTYLKAHPGMSKEERKALCRLIDSRKLSPEASFHATQNDRLPIRSVIQVLFSEQTKLNQTMDWSGSFIIRSPNSTGLVAPTSRCLSKREAVVQQMEINRLKEDVLRLQSQCISMQGQIDRLVENKKKSSFFRWKKFGMPSLKSVSVAERMEFPEGEVGFGRQTPIDMKAKLIKGRTTPKWRKSMS